jgi:hypothetical protein
VGLRGGETACEQLPMKALMKVPGSLEGVVDLHAHTSPDINPRRFDDIELARDAARPGLAASLIKSNQNSTVERSRLVPRIVCGIGVSAGLVLKATVGGLNPATIMHSLNRCPLRPPALGGRRTPSPPPSGSRTPGCLAPAASDSGPAWPSSAPASGRTQPGSARWLRIRPPTARLPRDSGVAALRPAALVRPPFYCITNVGAGTDGLL